MNLFNHHSRSAGMTLIELAIVMGMVSLLLAMVLGLARHVDAILKVRQAQAELSEWQATLDRWHEQFGEYPHARIDTVNDTLQELFDNPDWTFKNPDRYPFNILTNDLAGAGCYVVFQAGNMLTNITFRSFMSAPINTVDPWGTPYIYRPGENNKTCVLFSCGPNRQTRVEGNTVPSSTPAIRLDPTIDDVYP